MAKYREILEAPNRIFAVGDIHGCRKELSVLLEHLLSQYNLSSEDQLIFIGDYIDRGPDAKGVVDLLLNIKKEFPNIIFLRGNHEDMFLDFMGFEGTMGEVYIPNGGKDTLASYGLSILSTQEQILEQFPRDHLSFFLDLESYVTIGDYIFAHAGLDPQRGLTTQMDTDIFWIREAFINHPHDFKKTVVFGHTPYQEVMFDLPYKIGIDTGCVYGNKLSCLELNGKLILEVDLGSKQVKTKAFPL